MSDVSLDFDTSSFLTAAQNIREYRSSVSQLAITHTDLKRSIDRAASGISSQVKTLQNARTTSQKYQVGLAGVSAALGDVTLRSVAAERSFIGLGSTLQSSAGQMATFSAGMLGASNATGEAAVSAFRYGTILRQLNGYSEEYLRTSFRFKEEQQNLTRVNNQAARSWMRFGAGARSARGIMQNTSFQVQDMIVQAQMGTDTFMIMTQQVPQLVSAFGTIGAIVGGVAAGVFAVLFILRKIRQQAEALYTDFRDVSGVVKEVLDAVEGVGSAMRTIADIDMAKGFAETLDSTGHLRRDFKEILELIESVSRREVGDKIGSFFDGVTRETEIARNAIDAIIDANIEDYMRGGVGRTMTSDMARELTSPRPSQIDDINSSGFDLIGDVGNIAALDKGVTRIKEAAMIGREEFLRAIQDTTAEWEKLNILGEETGDGLTLILEKLAQEGDLLQYISEAEKARNALVERRKKLEEEAAALLAKKQEYTDNSVNSMRDEAYLLSIQESLGADSIHMLVERQKIEAKQKEDLWEQNELTEDMKEVLREALRFKQYAERTEFISSEEAERLKKMADDAARLAESIRTAQFSAGARALIAQATLEYGSGSREVLMSRQFVERDTLVRNLSDQGATPEEIQDVVEDLKDAQRLELSVFERNLAERNTRRGANQKSGTEIMGELSRAIAQQERLVGVYGDQYEITSRIIQIENDLGEKRSEISDREIESMAHRQIYMEEIAQRTQDFYLDTKSTISSSIMDMTRSAESFKDIATGFRNMVAEILASVYEKSFIDPMADAVGGWLTGWLFPSANGNAFSRGSLTAFANGGVVSSPTLFPMSGGNTGLMGEAGPEAIIPLSRTSSGRLGVEVAGGSGGTTVQVVQNFSFSANGDEAVKRIIQGEMPKIAAVTKRSVIDARSRGGQMKTVFGR